MNNTLDKNKFFQKNQTTPVQGIYFKNRFYLIYFSLVVSGFISFTVYLAWLVPSIAEYLPSNWSKMQFTTALSMLVLSIGELLKTWSFSQSRVGRKSRLLGVVFCGSFATLIALNTLSQHLFEQGIPLNQLFVDSSLIPLSHLMSIQSSVCVMILGVLQVVGHKQTGVKGACLDASYLILFAIILIYISGYIFGVFQFIGSSKDVLISSQALIAVIFLAYSAMIRRAPFGNFSVLVEQGTGSRFARVMLPFAVVLSYAIIMYSNKLLTDSQLSMQSSAALTAAGLATILVVVVIFLARRINRLESNLTDITITDELTQINNLRGFYLIGEQVYQDAVYTGTDLVVYYIDLDGLKVVNDNYGHKVGSELIKSFANILLSTFDKSDVVGRLGGDEFAVVAHKPRSNSLPFEKKLQNAVDSYNHTINKPFRMGFSLGEVHLDTNGDTSLRDWVHQADEAMYRVKHQKKKVQDS